MALQADILPRSYLITAFDPGGTTGMTITRVESDDIVPLDRCAVPYHPPSRTSPVSQALRWAARYEGIPHVLVYEDFHIRPNQRSVDPVALRVIGAFEDRLMVLGSSSPYLKVFTQEPSEAKRGDQKHPVTNDDLRTLGMLATETDARHMNDAARHTAVFLAKRHHPRIEEVFGNRLRSRR